MLRSHWIHGVVGVALLAIPLFLFSNRAHAIQDSEDKVLFGPLTVGFGQSVRLNAYGIGNPNEAPWLFLVRVFNRRGDLAQELKAQAAPGAVASFEINIGNPDEFPVDRLGRRTRSDALRLMQARDEVAQIKRARLPLNSRSVCRTLLSAACLVPCGSSLPKGTRSSRWSSATTPLASWLKISRHSAFC
jgi:hypothetical protein